MRPNLSQFTLLMILLAIPIVQWVVHRNAPPVIAASEDADGEPESVAQIRIAAEVSPAEWAESAAATAEEITRLGQAGQVRAAMNLTRYALALPRHPDRNDPYGHGHATMALDRMLEVLQAYELWDEAIEFCSEDNAANVGNALVESKRLRLLGAAFAAKRQLTFRSRILSSHLGDVLDDLALRESNDVHHNEICVPADRIEIDFEGNEAARTHIRQSVEFIDAQLLAMRSDFKSALPKLKGTDATALQHARMLAADGQKEPALAHAKTWMEVTRFKVPALTVLAELYAASDDLDSASETLEQLNELTEVQPIDSTLQKRLQAIHAKVGSEWSSEKLESGPDTDAFVQKLAEQFPLAIEAPGFELMGVQEQKHSLADYRGKPVLVVFYLGRECLHCSRQLKHLAPAAFEFEELGIPIIGISTDDANALDRAFKGYRGRIPYPLASDGNLDVFSAYRLHEDGMDEPLHGTFLLDGEGRVLWRDSGEEPFMDMDFLLAECERLLRHTSDAAVSTWWRD